MKKTYLFLFVITVFMSHFSFGQTGPGGVGDVNSASNLVLWLNPDKGSNTNTAFIDQSNYGYDFTGGNGATLNSNTVNGQNSYSYNGIDDYFEHPNEINLNPDNFSVFAVNKVLSSNLYKAVFSTRNSLFTAAILYSKPTTNEWTFWTASSGWQTLNTGVSTASNWAIHTCLYKPGTNNKKVLINNKLIVQATHNYAKTTTYPFRIGAGYNEGAPNYFFKGDMGEIIMFKTYTNLAQNTIINNYLAAKYGMTLDNDDIYTQDNSANGNFDHNVAGIGQATDGSNHTDSQGTGIIRMNTPSALANNDFLFWGEETKNPTYNFTADANYFERLNSKWRVSKQNYLGGTVSVQVKASDITFNSAEGCNALRLIVSNSSTFATKTTYNFTLSAGVYTATGVSFTDGDYFTLEYVDKIVIDVTTAYNGSGTSNVPNTTDSCYKLLVKATADGTPSLTENAYVREVEVEAGGKLVVDTGFYLQVKNGINNAGDIRLIGNAQILQDHTGTSQVTGAGNLYKDQKSINTDVYQSGYWTSPVTTNGTTFTIDGVLKDGTTATSATSTPVDINFTDIHTLDGDKTTTPITISGRWLAKLINAADWTRQIDPTAVTFNPGEGWNMKGLGANFTFKGILNDGDYSSSIDQNMLSLIGNPYPSALDANQFINDNVEGSANSAIVGTLYFWEAGNAATHVRGDYSGGYATRTLVGGTPFNTKAPSQYIAVGQAFFVWRSVAGTGTIQFKNSQRVFQTVGGPNPNQFYGKNGNTKREVSDTTPRLRFGFEFDTEDENIGIFHRQVLIAFAGLTNNYDNGYDGEMFDKQPTDMALKTTDWASDFVITAIQDFDESLEIPLSVYLDQDRHVTFKVDALENITTNVYLKDATNNQYYNLTGNNVSVSMDIAVGEYKDRFYITFANSALGIDDELLNAVQLYQDGQAKELVIKTTQNNTITSVKMYNLLGQEVVSVAGNQKENMRISTQKLAAAVYIVKVKTNEAVFSKKILITK